MRKTHKILATLLALCLLVAVGVPARAKNGDIIGKIYSTDIIASINGVPIPSYNIGGRTVVLAEDLEDLNYNFSASYDDGARLLTVFWLGLPGVGAPHLVTASKGSSGRVVGNVYETDIRVMFNNREVRGYNIGGRTAVCLEDLGVFDESSPNAAYGYSTYLARATWNAEARTIALDFFCQSGGDDDILPYHSVNASIKDDVLYFTYDQIGNAYRYWVIEAEYSDAFQTRTPFVLQPVYAMINGKKTEVGLGCRALFSDWNGWLLYRLDDSKMKTALAPLITPHKSYEQAVAYVNSQANYTVVQTVQSPRYTVWQLDANTFGMRYSYVVVSDKQAGGLVQLGWYTNIGSLKFALSGDTLTQTVSPYALPGGGAGSLSSDFNLTDYDFTQ